MTQKPSDEELELFISLFSGYESAHGQYEVDREESSGKKLGRAQTHSRGASRTDYLNHLSGLVGIGIIPLLREEKCWFGALDIDIKGDTKMHETHEELESKIRRYDLPLMLFRSKSNGAHLYFFGSEPVSARLLQGRLAEFAMLLGYGGCEVFPKQVTRIKPTDAGNWINLPLFGDTRKALYEGKELERDKALKLCTYYRRSEDELRAFSVKHSDHFLDGPPCLQIIHGLGVGEGGRNNTLMNVAIYMRLKYPDDWQEKLHEYNEEFVQPPLPRKELTEIASNSIRKDYHYTCKQPPICNHCDKKTCKKRKYGVGSGDNSRNESVVLPITDVIKYVAGKDSYRWGVNTGTAMLEFSTEELLSVDAHRKKFMELMNTVLPPMKEKEFFDQLQNLIANCEVIYDPEDASEEGQLISAIERWFLDKGSVNNADELIKARWWKNPEDNKFYFRGQALQDYLKHQEKIQVRPHKLWRCLEVEFKASKDMLRIKSKRRRVWVIPELEQENDELLSIPKIEKPKEII